MDATSPLGIYALTAVTLQVCFFRPTSGWLEPFDLLYHDGVEAFYSSDYENVVRYMERSLSSFSELRRIKVHCRLKCKDRHPCPASPSEWQFFDMVLRRARCLNECLEGKAGSQSLHKVSEDVLQDFHRRIPYNFLQLAYQKILRVGPPRGDRQVMETGSGGKTGKNPTGGSRETGTQRRIKQGAGIQEDGSVRNRWKQEFEEDIAPGV